MPSESLLANRKASQMFFALIEAPALPAQLARRCRMKADEAGRLLERMERAGLVSRQGQGRGRYAVDWDRFLPLFITHAMGIYATALPWKYIPYYAERGKEDFIEAACARSERELARAKVKLSGNELFVQLVQTYLRVLVTEIAAPEDYLEDLRLQDAIDEFEYALLKLVPLMRPGARSAQRRELRSLLLAWYKQIQAHDAPTGAALRAACQRLELTKA